MSKPYIVSALGAEVEGRVWTVSGQRAAFTPGETKEMSLSDVEAAGFRAMGFAVDEVRNKKAAEAAEEAGHE